MKAHRYVTLVAMTMLAAPLGAAESDFPRPLELEPDVRFWVRVYTEIDTNGGFLHDARDLSIVYETLSFDAGASSRTRSRTVAETKDRYAAILTTLARGKRVVPVLVAGAAMPATQELPEALAALSRRNAVVLTEAHFNRDVDELIATIEEPAALPAA